ncbi:MAG TPA: hypothetical protein VNT99_14440, partial [Methylomirabilota bacterium]|nr:hypothetical protein [Methylomirabilota bacterium]
AGTVWMLDPSTMRRESTLRTFIFKSENGFRVKILSCRNGGARSTNIVLDWGDVESLVAPYRRFATGENQ